MKAGDKTKAEHHGLQARISSWRADAQKAKTDANTTPGSAPQDPELKIAGPKIEPVKLPGKFPDMPWKKKKPAGTTGNSESQH
jgi:hypothetical protein